MAGVPGQAAGPGGRAEHGAVRAALPPCVCAGEAPRLHAEPPDACGGSVRLVPVLPSGGRAAHRTAENMAVLGDLRRQAGSCWDTLAGTTAACPPRPACGDRAGRREGAPPHFTLSDGGSAPGLLYGAASPQKQGRGMGPLVPGQPCPGPRWPPPWRKGSGGRVGVHRAGAGPVLRAGSAPARWFRIFSSLGSGHGAAAPCVGTDPAPARDSVLCACGGPRGPRAFAQTASGGVEVEGTGGGRGWSWPRVPLSPGAHGAGLTAELGMAPRPPPTIREAHVTPASPRPRFSAVYPHRGGPATS